ncbi:MAG: hypothetical protein ABSC20_08500 [Candidatus Bathyarchaeia archaeon]
MGDRVQIPKLIRWEFKLEIGQVLRVGFSVPNMFRDWQFFYAKMEKDGRVLIPREILSIWQDEKTSLTGYIVEVTLEPA